MLAQRKYFVNSVAQIYLRYKFVVAPCKFLCYTGGTKGGGVLDGKEIGQRISQRRSELGMTQSDIATKIGVAISTVQRYEKGQISKIKLPVVEAIARALQADPNWLIGKSGSMDPRYQEENSRMLPSNAYPLDALEVVAYNVIGSIAAGYDSTAVEEYTGDVQEVPRSSLHGRSPEDFFVLRVKGNSMYPQFLEGDHVLVLRCDEVDNGTVAVVLYNGDEATLKKVWRGNGYLDLIPINPEYQPRRIEGADLSQCHILGRAAALLRDFN